MDYYAKTDGSNEFFARRALYNCTVKLKRGDAFAAKKFYAVAALCLRSGGVSDATAQRILALKKILEAGNNFASSVPIKDAGRDAAPHTKYTTKRRNKNAC